MITFRVRGSWSFPADMLRYDDAEPARPEDVDVIQLLSTEEPTLAMLRGRFEVTLRSPRPPTEARWGSFLWRVIEVRRDPQ